MRKMLMALAATAALGTVGFTAPASAQTAPVNELVTAIQNGKVQADYVQHRRHYSGRNYHAGRRYVGNRYYAPGRYYGRPYYGNRYGYYRRNNGNALAAGALGLATGAIIGGAIAQSQAAPVYGGNVQSYCAQRFKSYDPASGTYLGYDGRRHSCP
ncbi:BA14K family protein [Microvirga sp. M2]|uniref:BA14K family protein n=1 Tax=Microvirga sp. M2 TaxID=3073270 RepID=UPI0039C21917